MSDQQIIQGIEDAAKKLLPPPIGTQGEVIAGEPGTKELLAMLVLMTAIQSRGE